MITELLGTDTFEALFPNGISRYAINGILVGLGTVIIYFRERPREWVDLSA